MLWWRVDWHVVTDGLKELAASVFSGQLFDVVEPEYGESRISETSVTMYQSAQRHIPENLYLFQHSCEKFIWGTGTLGNWFPRLSDYELRKKRKEKLLKE